MSGLSGVLGAKLTFYKALTLISKPRLKNTYDDARGPEGLCRGEEQRIALPDTSYTSGVQCGVQLVGGNYN